MNWTQTPPEVEGDYWWMEDEYSDALLRVVFPVEHYGRWKYEASRCAGATDDKCRRTDVGWWAGPILAPPAGDVTGAWLESIGFERIPSSELQMGCITVAWNKAGKLFWSIMLTVQCDGDEVPAYRGIPAPTSRGEVLELLRLLGEKT